MEKKDLDFIKKVTKVSEQAMELSKENADSLQMLRADIKEISDLMNEVGRMHKGRVPSTLSEAQNGSQSGKINIVISFINNVEPNGFMEAKNQLADIITSFIFKNGVKDMQVTYSKM
tara:strand:+ start:2612 stop:2962 length:351 start_codon:yes stop_codon:yes gene_type:complete